MKIIKSILVIALIFIFAIGMAIANGDSHTNP